jgi:hypothetical protein
MSKPIAVRYDALTGDCAPVLRLGAAAARLRSDDERWLFAPCAAVGVS